MSARFSPCQGCTERTVGCHGNCMRYKLFDINNDKRRAKRQADISAQPNISKYTYQQNHKGNTTGWVNVGSVNAKARERALKKKGWTLHYEVPNHSRIRRDDGGDSDEGLHPSDQDGK